MSSRRFTDAPWPWEASMISPTSRSAIVCSFRARANPTPPPHPRGGAGAGAPLHGDRVGAPANPPRAHLEQGPGVLHGLLQRDDRVVGRLLADAVQGVVDDPLGKRLLAAHHDLVDELADQHVLVDRIGSSPAPGGSTAPRHASPPTPTSSRRTSTEPPSEGPSSASSG